jgi:hypothetical protein
MDLDGLFGRQSGSRGWDSWSDRAAGSLGLLTRFGGLIILAAVLGLVFWLTFTIGSPLQQWLDENAVAPLAGGQGITWHGRFWLRGMVVDGIIGGVGSRSDVPAHPGDFLCGFRPAGGCGLHGAAANAWIM